MKVSWENNAGTITGYGSYKNGYPCHITVQRKNKNYSVDIYTKDCNGIKVRVTESFGTEQKAKLWCENEQFKALF